MAVSSTQTIFKNTVLMYIRMALTMLISLVSVRVVLNALGESDYGLYNVVGGVIGVLSCLSTTLSISTQRYISYALGQNDEAAVKNIFAACLQIFIGLSLIILVLGETIGLWFVNNKLTIPDGQMGVTNWLYQLSLLSFILSILRTPYHGVMFANEKFSFYALISIAESVLKLLLVLMLPLFSNGRLLIYAIMVLLLSIFSYVVSFIYDLNKFSYTRNVKTTDKSLFKDILSFSGWTLYGALAGAGMIQGNTILVNMFFGTIANASRAIAMQVGSIIELFCANFITTIKPSMIRGLSEGNHAFVVRIFSFGNKFIFYSMLAVCLPLFIQMPFILELWLKTVSPDMILFSRIMLIYSLMLSLHHPITIIMQALNKVKKYHAWVDTFIFLSMPLTYVFFKLGYGAEATFVVSTVMVFLAHCMRVMMLSKNYEHLNIKEYILFFITALFITVVLYIGIAKISTLIDNQWISLVVTLLLSVALIPSIGYVFALNKSERDYLNTIVKNKLGK